MSLERSLREQKPLSVLLANFDSLGMINRAYGYEVADQVIAGLAQNLRRHMRSTDVLARFAGNKFAFILESCTAEQMAVAARRFLHIASNQAIETASGPIRASLRIGGVLAPRHGRTAQILLQHAEEALEMARTNASDRFIVYKESLVRRDERTCASEVTREITAALRENRIELALQPVVDAQRREVAFYEALIRIRRTDGSQLSPDRFLPTAERVGLVQMLDERMLELAIRHLNENPDLRIAFNISPATAHNPDWPLNLKAALAKNPEHAKRLIIEITETFAIDNLETTNRVIEEMKAVGVCVAMDDFGSGHTSFRGLRSLNFDNLVQSTDDQIFVRALVELARHIGVPVVGEWIENEETARILTDWGVQYLQGHHFGRAITSEEQPYVQLISADRA